MINDVDKILQAEDKTIVDPYLYVGTLETPRSSIHENKKNQTTQTDEPFILNSQKNDSTEAQILKLAALNKTLQTHDSNKHGTIDDDYQLALKLQEEDYSQLERMETRELIQIQNPGRGDTPEIEAKTIDIPVEKEDHYPSLEEPAGARKMYLAQGFKDYHIEALFRHNFYRAFHPGTKSLTLSMELCEQARASADQQAEMNIMGHVTDRKGAGENLHFCHYEYYAKSPSKMTVGGTDSFYTEVTDFLKGLNHATKMPDKKTFSKWGHYTQLIWKDTFEMGVGFAKFTDPEKAGYPMIVTYRYRSHGNFNDQYPTKCSLPQRSLSEIKEIINQWQEGRVNAIIDDEEELDSKFRRHGIQEWQIDAWRHFNGIRYSQGLPPVMLDVDLCVQCSTNDGKGYWSMSTTACLEGESLDRFVQDYFTNQAKEIFKQEADSAFTSFGLAVEIQPRKTELRCRFSK